MSKCTVSAPANIAFIKYWGALDIDRALPLNSSISMTLEQCVTLCTAELLPGAPRRDEIWLAEADGRLTPAGPDFARRVLAHIERLRQWAGREEGVRIGTRNTFPAAAGLASSASGFAALTLAVTRAFGLDLGPEDLSLLARRSGSGSACRSVVGGYVEWRAGDVPEANSFAVQMADADHWDLRDVIAVVEIGPKTVSSLDGHRRAPTSPYYGRRRELLDARLDRVRGAIRDRDLSALGPVLEEEAIDLHLIAMSSHPPIFYWSPGTLEVLRTVRELRQEGLEAWATMDAGANVHVICDPESEDEVAERLGELASVGFVIRDGVGDGPETETQALF